MKAAVYKGPGILDIEEVKTPVIEKENEILVKVSISAICGTDIKTYLRGHRAFKPPVILGHEFAGEVAEIGDEVTTCKVGDKVTVAPFIECGRCFYCQNNVAELCKNRIFPSNGAFTEYVKIDDSYAKTGMVKIPDNVDMQAASLTEPLACVINAIEDCQIKLGDRVLVVGAGPMGLLNVLVSKLQGAAEVLVSEPVKERREQAQKVGALTIDPTTEDIASRVKELTDGLGVDVLIAAVANTEIVKGVLELVRSGGKIMFFGGFPGSSTLEFDPNLVHYRQVSILGSSGYTSGQFRQAANLIATRRINLEELITHSFDFDQILDAFEVSVAHQGLKITLSMN